MFVQLQMEQTILECTSSAHLDFRELFSERKPRYEVRVSPNNWAFDISRAHHKLGLFE